MKDPFSLSPSGPPFREQAYLQLKLTVTNDEMTLRQVPTYRESRRRKLLDIERDTGCGSSVKMRRDYERLKSKEVKSKLIKDNK